MLDRRVNDWPRVFWQSLVGDGQYEVAEMILDKATPMGCPLSTPRLSPMRSRRAGRSLASRRSKRRPKADREMNVMNVPSLLAQAEGSRASLRRSCLTVHLLPTHCLFTAHSLSLHCPRNVHWALADPGNIPRLLARGRFPRVGTARTER